MSRRHGFRFDAAERAFRRRMEHEIDFHSWEFGWRGPGDEDEEEEGEESWASDEEIEEWMSEQRCQDRCQTILEELMAAAWHPRRVAAWVEAGAWEMLDS
jgi:hypothetical protein